ncbi:MAG: DUF2628 domain-containing protein [Mesorhizobium sp.]|nr:DUF2628 domain-containing protein [Mesorhizobium sp.]MCO5161460.1 DUF2628 domain-containing protein [Mesorhizobium sp.]
MSSFLVMEAPEGRDEAVYIRDGFHLVAFLLPPVWLAWHRLWIEALVAFAVMAVLASLGNVSGFGGAAPLLSLLVSLYVGLEAPAIRIAALRRRGWREWGVVDAYDRDDAETKHLFAEGSDTVEDSAAPATPMPSPEPLSPRPVPAGPALGLFSYPGAR